MRLDLLPVFRAHWRSLIRTSNGRPDWVARSFCLIAVLIVPLAILFKLRLTEAAPLLSAVALLAGVLMGVFIHMSQLRLRLTDDEESGRIERIKRQLDESVAHLLTAALLCGFDAIFLAIEINLKDATNPKDANPSAWYAYVPSSLAMGCSVYIFILFMMTIRRMYAAYVDMNDVNSDYSGFSTQSRHSENYEL